MTRVLCGGKANADGMEVHVPKPDRDPFFTLTDLAMEIAKRDRQIGRHEQAGEYDAVNRIHEERAELWGRFCVELRLATQ